MTFYSIHSCYEISCACACCRIGWHYVCNPTTWVQHGLILANQADNAGKVVDVSLRDIEIPVGGVIGGAEYFVPLVVDTFKHYAIVRINDMRLSPLDE